MFSMLPSSEMFTIFNPNNLPKTVISGQSNELGLDLEGQVTESDQVLAKSGCDRVLLLSEGAAVLNDLDLSQIHQDSLGSNLEMFPSLVGQDQSPTSSSSATSNEGSVWSDEDRDEDDIANILNLNYTDLTYFNESILFSAKETDLVEEVVSQQTDMRVDPSPPKGENATASPKPIHPKISRDPQTKLYHCPHCDKSFQYSSRLQRHLSAHEEKKFHCHICDKYFSRSDVLSNHLSKVHQQWSPPNKSPSSSSLVESSATTKMAELYPCHICEAKLSSKFHLNRHLKSHENKVGAFTCNFCGKSFDVKHKFQRHMRLHLSEKKFKCHVCHMSFLQREFLSRHLLTHSGENPFKCNQCGKGFNQLINLKQHIERLHSSDASKKTHKCSHCEKRFYTSPELKNHLLYHVDTRMFHCSTCESSFVEKRHLDRHIRRMHSKIKNYFCNHCSKAFYEKYELNHHKKSCQ
ncbi:zinc finger protein 501-like [Tigriopus californicus]|nr:zinc finger protein 501-like [Tigriopus californicus]|eukprot:TCALIF_02626-PA protein Name:"Similar to ZNF34 Zinc finger protein 34 (Homo sapiens)" AED:0.02 eAED:0.02 QI:0/-1/0/1/-1/1/1/0/463